MQKFPENQELIDQINIISEECDSAFFDVIGAHNDVFSESIAEKAKNAINKLWDKILEFFNKTNRYIKEVLTGRVQGLNVELNKTSVVYYKKTEKIYELEFSAGDEFTVVDVEECLKILSGLVKDMNKPSDSFDTGKNGKNEYDGLNIDKDSNNDNAYVEIREKIIKKNVPISSLSGYVSKINRYYNKAINLVYDISVKVKRKAKNSNKSAYRDFVTAKNITNSILSMKNLIRVE